MAYIKNRIARAVKRNRPEVYMRSDFADMAGYDQVGRALRQLTREGVFIRIGYGLYAKATTSPLTGNRPVPRVGVRKLGEDALRKLNIGMKPSESERLYNQGDTTQVPSGRVFAVDKRVRRKIGYNGMYIGFERAQP